MRNTAPTGRVELAGQALRLEPWRQNATEILTAAPLTSAPILDFSRAIRELAGTWLTRYGGLLLRGFSELTPQNFRRLAAALSGSGLLPYDFASTPRREIDDGIYSSTEYPAHQWIPQHNEQSYARQWPLKIWFYCAATASEGGDTPLTDSRVVYRSLDPLIRAKFTAKRVMYVRNFDGVFDLPWQQVFRTASKAKVAEFCRAQDIVCQWFEDGRLRTRQTCQAIARHPADGAPIWFNQAHLFHVSALEPGIREALLEIATEDNLPRNAYYGTGEPIEEDALDEIRRRYADATLRFTWEAGDVLLLDNMLMAHGRAPFRGPRQVLVAMAEPHTAQREIAEPATPATGERLLHVGNAQR